ncbi:MAG: hypothetical protein LBT16_05140 [Treponema sp.]|jgi:hypothetical protein|nr:hypothetical protein [Treponema sp.]
MNTPSSRYDAVLPYGGVVNNLPIGKRPEGTYNPADYGLPSEAELAALAGA